MAPARTRLVSEASGIRRRRRPRRPSGRTDGRRRCTASSSDVSIRARRRRARYGRATDRSAGSLIQSEGRAEMPGPSEPTLATTPTRSTLAPHSERVLREFGETAAPSLVLWPTFVVIPDVAGGRHARNRVVKTLLLDAGGGSSS